MKRSFCIAIVLTMFALPVNAHHLEMLQKQVVYALIADGLPLNFDCLLKTDFITKSSEEDLLKLSVLLTKSNSKKSAKLLNYDLSKLQFDGMKEFRKCSKSK